MSLRSPRAVAARWRKAVAAWWRGAVAARWRSGGRGAIGTAVILLASFGLVAAIGFMAIAVAPDLFADENLPRTEYAEERDRVRTQALAVLAGAIAVAGAAFSGLSYLLSRSGQVTERFTKAIEQLGDAENPLVRRGGIYALERIAYDSRRDHPRVMEVLTAYVRDPPQCKNGAQQPTTAERPENVQAALAVLKRRKHWYDGHKLDLELLVLPDAKLPEADLRGAILKGAELQNADLRRTHLSERKFGNEEVKGADLTGANLTGAHLEGADLTGAILERADLRGAHLNKTRIGNEEVKGADLTGADLTRAHLEGADLTGAILERATLRGASANAKTKPKDRWDELRQRGVVGLPSTVADAVPREGDSAHD
jgi:uncharacterized protein YjbI with pentapeptide repeats